MKKKKPEIPSKVSCRLDEFIDERVIFLSNQSGTQKTQVIRAIFNCGLNSFFNNGYVNKLSDVSLKVLVNESKLNEVKYKTSLPMSCALTEIQVNDLYKTPIVDLLPRSHAIRLVFHIGIAEFNREYTERLAPIKKYKEESGYELTKTDIFNASRDIVHFNCFDKV